MEFTEFQKDILKNLPGIDIKVNEPMSKHTSLRIGGAAEAMAFPADAEQIKALISYCSDKKISYRILGAGTNVLAPDDGLHGLVICLKDSLDGMKVNGNIVLAMAGVTMTRLAMFAAKNGLSGLEFAHGIPGTVGGGVYMNAGAYGGEISQICTNVTVLNQSGTIEKFTNAEMDFSYRHSILETNGAIVLSAEFTLTEGEPEHIQETMRCLQKKRSASQPLEYPSAGSAFKRPVGGYAAALIDSAGLKGYRVGGAEISEKHAGFAVNAGKATASDMKKLLSDVSDIVYEKSGIRLEPEIRIW